MITVLALFLTATIMGPRAEMGSPPLPVRARATAGPFYVGQAIEVEVEVDRGAEGGEAHPTFEPPRVAGVEVVAVEGSAGERSARFVVIPRRPGAVEVGPFRVRLGGRSGASRAFTRTVAAIPSAGRTSSFLGGVGAFEVKGEVEPTSVQAGQAVEYKLTIRGPAAWGSDQPPDLSRWPARFPGLKVEEPVGTLTATNPPSRTFRYRLRPLRGGPGVLPPVSVSAFEPSLRAFQSRTTSRLTLDVASPDTFDPAAIDYGGTGPMVDRSRRWPAIVGLAAAAVGLTVAGYRGWRRARRGPRPTPRRMANDLAGSLDPGWPEVVAAQRITDGMATFLHRAIGRVPGVLTPAEAVEAISAMTGDRELAGRAGRLIECCDALIYGGIEPEPGELVGRAKGVLAGIAGASGGTGSG